MNENIKALFEKVAVDEELQAKFSELKTPEEAYELASTLQDGFTKEEFITEVTRIREAMEENLTDEDMARSAGGGSPDPFVVSISVATAATGISVATAGMAAAI